MHEKDVLIQEKEKLYVELKNILAKQSGPEVAEKLATYQQNLKERTKQLRDMSGELKSYQSQVNAYRFEIERIDKSIGDVKRQYFDRRRRELRNIPADGEIIEEEDESDLRGDPEDPDNHDAARYDGRMLQDNYYQNRDRSDAGQLPEADEDAPDHAALSEPIEQPADDDALAAPVDDAQEVPPEAVADEDAEPADNDNAAEPEGEDNQPNDE